MQVVKLHPQTARLTITVNCDDRQKLGALSPQYARVAQHASLHRVNHERGRAATQLGPILTPLGYGTLKCLAGQLVSDRGTQCGISPKEDKGHSPHFVEMV
jgi:hypothetical protein